MKKEYFVSIFIFFYSFTFAQLHVGTNAYIYSNDQFIFVRDNVNLAANGNVYLRNQSQLLQGGTSAGTNSGTGSVSVFQEGTVNNFQYNYWCSPVGIAASGAGNNAFGIAALHRPTGIISSVPATILPMGNLNGAASPLAIAPYWIWKFITSANYAQWTFVGNNPTLNPGEGFTMKGTSGTDNTVADTNDGVQNNIGSAQRYDFRGKPNSGNITVPVTNGNFTLTGNPYPSAIDLHLFFNDPSNSGLTTGIAYFWEQVAVNSHNVGQYQGGYGAYAPATNTYTPASFTTFDGAGNTGSGTGSTGAFFERRFSPVGQGFMVVGTANGNITFRDSHRMFRREGAANQSQFNRTSNQVSSEFEDEYYEEIPNVAGIDYTQIRKNPASHFKIYATYNNQAVRPTTLAFMSNSSDGYDYGGDAFSASGEANEFYYVIPGMNREFVSVVQPFDIDKKIPVGFKSNGNTTFKLEVVDAYRMPSDVNVFLHDKITDLYHDIKNGFFEVTLSSGVENSRYEITFTNTTLSNPDFSNESLVVFQDNTNKNLVISNELNKEINSIQLYDVTGKLVISKNNMGSNARYQISTNSLSAGIYIAKVKTADNLVISKKIIIE